MAEELNTKAVTVDASTETVVSDDAKQAEAEKTFTQSDVSKIAAKEARKAEASILKIFQAKDKAELETLLPYIEAGRAAEESQKTEAERFTAALEKKDKDYAATLSVKDEEINALKTSLSAYEQEKALSAANVDTEWQELAIYKANALVNDDTDFKAALEIVLKENPKYVTAKPQPAPYTIPGMGRTKPTQTKADLNQIIFGINTKRG